MFDSYRKHVPRQAQELEIFWDRLGGRPSFENARVLDFGSSIGQACFDALERGASKVVGIEIDQGLLAFSRHRAVTEYAQHAERLVLGSDPLSSLEPASFDLVASKDVFEHVQSEGGLGRVLQDMHDVLVPGGLAYLGWGPLYYSPRGGHGLSKLKLGKWSVDVPWSHVLLPEPVLIALHNRTHGESFASISQYGLNKLRYAEYERVVYESPFEVLSYRVNVTDHPAREVVARLTKAVPALRDFLISTIYCVLRRPLPG